MSKTIQTMLCLTVGNYTLHYHQGRKEGELQRIEHKGQTFYSFDKTTNALAKRIQADDVTIRRLQQEKNALIDRANILTNQVDKLTMQLEDSGEPYSGDIELENFFGVRHLVNGGMDELKIISIQHFANGRSVEFGTWSTESGKTEVFKEPDLRKMIRTNPIDDVPVEVKGPILEDDEIKVGDKFYIGIEGVGKWVTIDKVEYPLQGQRIQVKYTDSMGEMMSCEMSMEDFQQVVQAKGF